MGEEKSNHSVVDGRGKVSPCVLFAFSNFFARCNSLPLNMIFDTFSKKITQTAVINIVFQRIFIKLDVSYASQHTFSKVTVTIFENYIYIVNIRGLEPRLRKMICSSTCLDIMRSNS